MKLRKQDKRVLGAVFLLTYLSGTTLFILSRWIRVASTVGEQHHPMEQWVRISHTALTYAIILALGYMLRDHVLPGLRSKRRLRSGVLVLSVFLFLTATALGILYSGDSAWNQLMVQGHSWIGIALPLLLFLHISKRVADKKKASRRTPIPLQMPSPCILKVFRSAVNPPPR